MSTQRILLGYVQRDERRAVSTSALERVMDEAARNELQADSEVPE